VLAVLLAISALLTVYSGALDDEALTLSKPVVAIVLIKRHVGFALGFWGALVAGFYATAAARGERPNIWRYRWGTIAFFTLQGALYLAIVLKRGSGIELYSALALLPPILVFGWLAWSFSAAGNVFVPARTRLSGLSTAELKDLYAGRPHGETPSR
jgi:hypothetical protein